jgi:Flp pilus assembly protein TadG
MIFGETTMTLKRFSLRRFFRAETGVAAIEFVFVLPFLLFLYFGMIDLTGLISANRKVTQAADAVSNLVTTHRNTFLRSDLTDYYRVVEMIMKPTPMSQVRVEFYGYRPNGGNVTAVWDESNNQGPGCGALPSTTSMIPLTTAGNDLIIGRVCMMYTPAVATFLGTQILGDTEFLVQETISQRPRSTPRLECRVSAGGALC